MKDGRSLDHKTLETYRFAALRLRKEHVSVAAIAKSFQVTKVAIYRWFKKADEKGARSLKSSRALGPTPKLNPDQHQQLLRWLRQPATKLGYATELWSGPRIRHLLRHQWGLVYHPKHMARLLRRLGLVLKFPERRALEQDPKELQLWKTRRWPNLRAWAHKHRALVFYADESLISLIPYVGRTWTFPKVQPKVRVSGKRGQHVGVTAAVNLQGRMCFELTADQEHFTSRVFLRFLRKMHREFPARRFLLIVDGAPVHTSKLVSQFAEQNHKWLRLEILPAYSPELNPSEEVWGFVKTKAMNGSMVKDKKELRKKTQKEFRRLKKNAERIASFFTK
jgi:transposase